jgi:hypothetical protein
VPTNLADPQVYEILSAEIEYEAKRRKKSAEGIRHLRALCWVAWVRK